MITKSKKYIYVYIAYQSGELYMYTMNLIPEVVKRIQDTIFHNDQIN